MSVKIVPDCIQSRTQESAKMIKNNEISSVDAVEKHQIHRDFLAFTLGLRDEIYYSVSICG